jgi:hypothetical protein
VNKASVPSGLGIAAVLRGAERRTWKMRELVIVTLAGVLRNAYLWCKLVGSNGHLGLLCGNSDEQKMEGGTFQRLIKSIRDLNWLGE